MIENVFQTVLKMSAGATVVIGVVLVLRLALKGAPKVYSYALWALVLLRLLCPVFPEFSLSAMPQKSIDNVSVTADRILEMPVSSGTEGTETPEFAEVQQPEEIVIQSHAASAVEQHVTWGEILAGIWGCGAAVMGVYSIWSLLQLRRRLRPAVKLRENIFQADEIDSPFVLGLIKPRVYLPSYLQESQAEYIIRHERCHIRRQDHVVKVLFFATLCLHWFNPLVWLAFVCMGHDMEASCDEAVMKEMEGDIRAEYASALLRLSADRRCVSPTPLAFSEGNPKSRIRNVLNYRKPRFWVILIAVFICIVAAVLLLTNPKTDNSQQLDYPGLTWGMSPKEVRQVLDIQDADIVKNFDSYLEVKGLSYFGYPAESVEFFFKDNALSSATVILADSVSRDELLNAMETHYGDAKTYTYTQLSGDTKTEVTDDKTSCWASGWKWTDRFTEEELFEYKKYLRSQVGYQSISGWDAFIRSAPIATMMFTTDGQLRVAYNADDAVKVANWMYDTLTPRDPLLNYPGLEWGMSQDEIVKRLNISRKDILEESTVVLKVSGLKYGDIPTSYIQFIFWKTVYGEMGLTEVEVVIPIENAPDRVREEIEKIHREPNDWYIYDDIKDCQMQRLESDDTYTYWISDETLQSYFTEAEQLRLWQFYEDQDEDSHMPGKYNSVMQTQPLSQIVSFVSGDGESYVVKYNARTLINLNYILSELEVLQTYFEESKQD